VTRPGCDEIFGKRSRGASVAVVGSDAGFEIARDGRKEDGKSVGLNDGREENVLGYDVSIYIYCLKRIGRSIPFCCSTYIQMLHGNS